MEENALLPIKDSIKKIYEFYSFCTVHPRVFEHFGKIEKRDTVLLRTHTDSGIFLRDQFPRGDEGACLFHAEFPEHLPSSR